ncbi:MAG TPA: hypothetical protein VHH72_06215 [Solirubrobacterales bacterium]|nr:hypothetical protein [Solirubrobacterales bacterium]
MLIERRFRGPADSANGGYACGVVAAALEPRPAVEVTLRAPPPLDRALSVADADGGVELRDGEQLIAAARPVAALDLAPPPPVTLEAAAQARRDSPLQERHPYPSCFVCSPERVAGDGLRVICGPVPGRDLVAAPFETADWMAANGTAVRDELIWSVLDCPSGIAGMLEPEVGVTMLGRLTAELRSPVVAGEDYVAVGWLTGRDGRKVHAGSAILDRAGEPLALAAATWIELRDQRSA